MKVFKIAIDGPLRVFGFVGSSTGIFPFINHFANDGSLVAYTGAEVLNGSNMRQGCFLINLPFFSDGRNGGVAAPHQEADVTHRQQGSLFKHFSTDASNGLSGDHRHTSSAGKLVYIGRIHEGKNHRDQTTIRTVGTGSDGHSIPNALSWPKKVFWWKLSVDQIYDFSAIFCRMTGPKVRGNSRFRKLSIEDRKKRFLAEPKCF